MAERQTTVFSKHVDRIKSKRFCLGITGLSKSGKSTFITSLINQLLQFDSASLPGFSPVLMDRLISVKIHPLEDKDLAYFPYAKSYEGLADANPVWPSSTKDVSGCLLELRLKKSTHSLIPWSPKVFSLFLEIRDYPGEWLLDLPLRDMSYSRWCAQSNAQFTKSPRIELLGDFLGELQQIDPLSDVDEEYLADVNRRFIKFLHACKYNTKSLSLIQPGRFLIPGALDYPSALCFVPLLKCSSYTEGQLASASKESYFKVCESRYKQYLQELVEPFYKTFFSRVDRQLILVDVVNALNSGPEYMDDMRQALTNITDSFSYGKQNRLLQLFRPKIDKVVFAATKIDQVLSEDHEAVRELIGCLIKNAYKNAQHEGVRPICEAVSAVRASKEVQHKGDRGITGLGVNGESIGYIHPTIPSRIPVGDEWTPFLDWKIPTLLPPKGLSCENSDPIPHIRIDTLLNILVEDKCL